MTPDTASAGNDGGLCANASDWLTAMTSVSDMSSSDTMPPGGCAGPCDVAGNALLTTTFMRIQGWMQH